MLEKKRTIYLDHASATPLDPEVLSAMTPYLTKEFGNPSSLHNSGVLAKVALDDAKKRIAKILSCTSDELIFTGSGTESNNLAIFGVARAYKENGNHIIISAIEHESVIEPTKMLEKEGFVISILPVDTNGLVSLKELQRLLTEKTILVSIMYANNEIGTIEPIKEIGRFLKEHHPQILFHVDGCQAGGQLSLSVKHQGIDLFSMNGSKIYGPKGIGLLYKDRHLTLSPIIYGGGQEKGLRSGTENIASIVGFVKALEIAETIRKDEVKRLTILRDTVIQKIVGTIEGLILTGHSKLRLANNINFTIEGVDGEMLVIYLNEQGIEAATGSACTQKTVEPSHVVLALGKSKGVAKTSIRFSLGRGTTKKDIDILIGTLPKVVQKIRSL